MNKDPNLTQHMNCCGPDSHAPAPTQDACTCTCKTCRKPRYKLWVLGFALFYVLSVVPVGLLLYTFKSEMGWDIFKVGGYHKFKYCIREALK